MGKIKNLNSLRNLKQFAGEFNADRLAMQIVKSLAIEGKRIIDDAYETKTFKDRTGNLRDSYVSAVFYKGRLVEDSVHFVGDEVAISDTYRTYKDSEVGGEEEGTKGRQEAQKFLGKLQFSSRPSGITLIIAAAMFYSSLVEGRGFRVISHVSYELDEIKRRGYKVDLFNTAISEDYITTRTIYREGGVGRMQIF